MKLKYYLRGLGAGILFSVLIFSFIVGNKSETLSDAEIIKRAKELGLVEKTTIDMNKLKESASGTPTTKPTPTLTPRPTATNTPTPTPTDVPESTPTPLLTEPLTPTPTSTPTPIPTSTPSPTPTERPKPTEPIGTEGTDKTVKQSVFYRLFVHANRCGHGFFHISFNGCKNIMLVEPYIVFKVMY